MTYSVDNDCGENGTGNSLAVIGIVNAPTEPLVAAAVQAGDDAEDNDSKYGHDGAAEKEESAISLVCTGLARRQEMTHPGRDPRRDEPCPCVHGTNDGLHDGQRVASAPVSSYISVIAVLCCVLPPGAVLWRDDGRAIRVGLEVACRPVGAIGDLGMTTGCSLNRGHVPAPRNHSHQHPPLYSVLPLTFL